MKGARFKGTVQKIFKLSQKAWNLILKPAVNTQVPVISMAVGEKSKKPHVDPATYFEKFIWR